jgi:hypothetical protein
MEMVHCVGNPLYLNPKRLQHHHRRNILKLPRGNGDLRLRRKNAQLHTINAL